MGTARPGAVVNPNALVLSPPEVLVARAVEKVDAQGRLTDDATCGFVRDLLAALER